MNMKAQKAEYRNLHGERVNVHFEKNMRREGVIGYVSQESQEYFFPNATGSWCNTLKKVCFIDWAGRGADVQPEQTWVCEIVTETEKVIYVIPLRKAVFEVDTQDGQRLYYFGEDRIDFPIKILNGCIRVNLPRVYEVTQASNDVATHYGKTAAILHGMNVDLPHEHAEHIPSSHSESKPQPLVHINRVIDDHPFVKGEKIYFGRPDELFSLNGIPQRAFLVERKLKGDLPTELVLEWDHEGKDDKAKRLCVFGLSHRSRRFDIFKQFVIAEFLYYLLTHVMENKSVCLEVSLSELNNALDAIALEIKAQEFVKAIVRIHQLIVNNKNGDADAIPASHIRQRLADLCTQTKKYI